MLLGACRGSGGGGCTYCSVVGQTVSVSLSWNGARESWDRNANEGFVSLQKKMGGMVNEGRRYTDEVECSVCSKRL